MGRQCPVCLVCLENDVPMKFRLQRYHNIPGEESFCQTGSLSKLPLQTLFLGNRCELFLISIDKSQLQILCSSTAAENPGSRMGMEKGSKIKNIGAAGTLSGEQLKLLQKKVFDYFLLLEADTLI